MSSYNREYVSRPLDGAEINNELFKIYKANFKSSSIQAKGNVPFNGVTAYKAQYPEPSKVIDVRRESCKPKPAKTLSSGTLLIKDSVSHSSFKPVPVNAYDRSDGHGERHCKPSGSYLSQLTHTMKFVETTAYNRQFNKGDSTQQSKALNTTSDFLKDLDMSYVIQHSRF